ncbi:MAG: hypoxanthine phosphoribosyltransferase [Pseudomonadota bacterium]
MTTKLTPVLTKGEIEKIVSALGDRISVDYQGRELVLVGILKGAFIFLSDLARCITIPVKIDFIGASSYADRSFSSGQVRLTKPLEIEIKGKDVLIVEDIVDTGLTLISLIESLKSMKPESIKVCALIDKQERRGTSVVVDYAGYVVEEGFLVGYGLDFAENFRNLPGIFHVELTPSEEKP